METVQTLYPFELVKEYANSRNYLRVNIFGNTIATMVESADRSFYTIQSGSFNKNIDATEYEKAYATLISAAHDYMGELSKTLPKFISAELIEKAKGGKSEKQKETAKEEVEESEPKEEPKNYMAIKEIFDNASRNLLNPKLRFGSKNPDTGYMDEIELTRAKDHSKNPGHLYVKLNSEYCGKITPDGKFIGSGKGYDTRGYHYNVVVNNLNELRDNPSEKAKAYGKETGNCSCCGRTLTDPTSIAAGIGPICAENWGM